MNYKRPKILVVDNYDSFTYNLIQIIREHGGCDYDVMKNDKIDIFTAGNYDGFIFSPGPGIPADAPVMEELLKTYTNKSFLGICLGHQAIAETFGMRLVKLDSVRHGLKTKIRLTEPIDYIFDGMTSEFNAGLYHSWGVCPDHGIPERDSQMRVTALNHEGIVMAVAHVRYNIRGVQFHPESFMSENGSLVVRNWIDRLLQKV
jgi:anthranilate synthase component II